MVFGKHLICQKGIVPYMTYADNGIVFTMKAIEMKLCRVVYGVRLRRLTRFEMCTVRKTEVILPIVQSETSGYVVIIHCFLNNPRH